MYVPLAMLAFVAVLALILWKVAGLLQELDKRVQSWKSVWIRRSGNEHLPDKSHGKLNGRWRVEVQLKGQRKVGRFDTLEEAKEAK